MKNAEGKTLHVERQKFGFRTIEYRHQYNGDEEDGVFINGRKVIMKGVNRHSFRPESGRTLSKAKNIEDVLLIKSMNFRTILLTLNSWMPATRWAFMWSANSQAGIGHTTR